MERSDLEHIIRAAGEIAKDDEIIIVGSQSILGQFPNARGVLILSNEADVYPKNKPEKAELINVMIGEDTHFQETHGYYAQGVGQNTAILPKGWEDRLVRVKN